MIILVTGKEFPKKKDFSEVLSELVLARYITDSSQSFISGNSIERRPADLIRLILMSGEDVVIDAKDNLLQAFPIYWNIAKKLNIPLKVVSLSLQYGNSIFERASIQKNQSYLKLDPRTLSIDDMLEVTLKHLNSYNTVHALSRA